MQAFRGISFDFLSLSHAQPLLPAPALAHAQPRACRLPAAGHLFLLKLNHCRRKDLTLSPPPSGSPCLLEETVNTKPHPEQNNTWASPHPRLPQHRFPRAISQHKPRPAHTAGGRWGFQPPETKRIKKKNNQLGDVLQAGQKQGQSSICPKWERGLQACREQSTSHGERRHQARQERRRLRGRETLR